MDNERSVVVSGGASTTGLLGIAFVVLKLVGVIDWSWWLVLAPFWAPFALLIAIVAFLVFIAIILSIIERV